MNKKKFCEKIQDMKEKQRVRKKARKVFKNNVQRIAENLDKKRKE